MQKDCAAESNLETSAPGGCADRRHSWMRDRSAGMLATRMVAAAAAVVVVVLNEEQGADR